MTERRRFILKASGALAAVASTAIVDAPYVIAQPKVKWRMSTTWTPTLDILQGAAERLARIVEEMSGGRFQIEVFPGGQIVGLFDCFDAVSKGTVEAYMGSPQYWNAKEPAIEWFATIPFGMNPEGMAAWYHQGDGLKLMEEAYAPFNLVPRPAMADSPQMAGWFRKRINATGDFKGLRMRIVNLGGKVYARAGATTVLTPGSEIYGALERGVIDSAEWIGPHLDMQINLHRTARYYYYPGWHEPGTMQDFGFNKKAYDALPVDLRRTLDHATAAVQVYGLAEFHAKNAIALQRLKTEFKEKVEVLQLPVPVLRDLRKLAGEVVKEESEKTPMARKVHASFTKFQALVAPWDRIAEGAYHQYVAG
jgi:TRAP-type mannitol/chloroaromatic compound transport system substrate-binding protein